MLAGPRLGWLAGRLQAALASGPPHYWCCTSPNIDGRAESAAAAAAPAIRRRPGDQQPHRESGIEAACLWHARDVINGWIPSWWLSLGSAGFKPGCVVDRWRLRPREAGRTGAGGSPCCVLHIWQHRHPSPSSHDINQCTQSPLHSQISRQLGNQLSWKEGMRGCFSIKTFLSWHRYYYYKDKTVVRPSYLYNRNIYAGKIAYLYWEGPQALAIFFCDEWLY